MLVFRGVCKREPQNDVAKVFVLAALFAPELCQFVRPSVKQRAGESRVPNAPTAWCALG